MTSLPRNGVTDPPRPAQLKSAVAAPLQPSPRGDDDQLDDPSFYLNRELTWLAFNQRVLAEADSPINPLLEHARISYFGSGGADEDVIGSADAMKRNLESRVEQLVPVEDPLARQTLRAILDLQLAPNRNAWLMQPDGTYLRTTDNPRDLGCQQAVLESLCARQSAPRVKRRRRQARRLSLRSSAGRAS
jgi:polyphosphate kinase